MAGLEEAGLLFWKEVVVALSDRHAAIDPQSLFFGLVPANEAQVLGILDEEHDRKMLQDRVEEVPGVFELGFSLPVFGELSPQLGLGHARGGALATGSAGRVRAVKDAVSMQRRRQEPANWTTPHR